MADGVLAVAWNATSQPLESVMRRVMLTEPERVRRPARMPALSVSALLRRRAGSDRTRHGQGERQHHRVVMGAGAERHSSASRRFKLEQLADDLTG